MVVFVILLRLLLAAKYSAPPSIPVAVLFTKVDPVTINCLPPVVIATAPPLLALFPSNKELVIVKTPVPPAKIAPPLLAVETLFLKTQPVNVKSEF